MNAIPATVLSVLLLAAAPSPPARAGAATPPTDLRVDCAQPRLPSQYETGRWLGQANAGQAYASRQRLMAEIQRACRKPGIRTVVLQLPRPADAPERGLAGRP